MFHLNAWDSFLLVYVVSVGAWLFARDLRSRRAESRAALEKKVDGLQTQVATLSGEIQRLSSRPPPPERSLSSPVVVIPKSEAPWESFGRLSFQDTQNIPPESLPRLYSDDEEDSEPTIRTSRPLIPVVIVDDSPEAEEKVPETLRSGYHPVAVATSARPAHTA